MNMLDIGGGFTGSELQLEEVSNVFEVEILNFQEIEVFTFKLQLEFDSWNIVQVPC